MSRPNFVSSANSLWALSPDYSRCRPMSNTYHALYFHSIIAVASQLSRDRDGPSVPVRSFHGPDELLQLRIEKGVPSFHKSVTNGT